MENRRKKFIKRFKEIIKPLSRKDMKASHNQKLHAVITVLGIDSVKKGDLLCKLVNLINKRELYNSTEILEMDKIIQTISLSNHYKGLPLSGSLMLEMNFIKTGFNDTAPHISSNILKETDLFLILGCNHFEHFYNYSNNNHTNNNQQACEEKNVKRSRKINTGINTASCNKSKVFVIHSEGACKSDKYCNDQVISSERSDIQCIPLNSFVDYFQLVNAILMEVSMQS